MVTILFVWSVVAVHWPNGPAPRDIYEWRELSVFGDPDACKRAAANLTLKDFRCITRNTGELK